MLRHFEKNNEKYVWLDYGDNQEPSEKYLLNKKIQHGDFTVLECTFKSTVGDKTPVVIIGNNKSPDVYIHFYGRVCCALTDMLFVYHGYSSFNYIDSKLNFIRPDKVVKTNHTLPFLYTGMDTYPYIVTVNGMSRAISPKQKIDALYYNDSQKFWWSWDKNSSLLHIWKIDSVDVCVYSYLKFGSEWIGAKVKEVSLSKDAINFTILEEYFDDDMYSSYEYVVNASQKLTPGEPINIIKDDMFAFYDTNVKYTGLYSIRYFRTTKLDDTFWNIWNDDRYDPYPYYDAQGNDYYSYDIFTYFVDKEYINSPDEYSYFKISNNVWRFVPKSSRESALLFFVVDDNNDCVVYISEIHDYSYRSLRNVFAPKVLMDAEIPRNMRKKLHTQIGFVNAYNWREITDRLGDV